MTLTERFQRGLARYLPRIPGLIPLSFPVYRFFRPKYSMGVVGVLFNEAGEVLLVEHVFHPRIPWGLPGGWVDNNEDPQHAVCRELREELSIQAAPLTIITAEKTIYNHLDLAYLCQTQDVIGRLSYELLAYRWFPLHQLPPLLRFHYDAIQRAKHLWEQQAWQN
jgi:8-oxo-dGTP diphosphatase